MEVALLDHRLRRGAVAQKRMLAEFSQDRRNSSHQGTARLQQLGCRQCAVDVVQARANRLALRSKFAPGAPPPFQSLQKRGAFSLRLLER